MGLVDPEFLMERSTRMNRRMLPVAVVALLLVVSGCGAPQEGGAGMQASVTGGGEAAEKKMAPEFSVQSVDGEAFNLADSNGKIRLIDFWATWCAPCREEIPMLNELQASYGEQGFQILAISDEDQEVIAEFIEEYGVQYTNLVGTEELSEAYGVLGLPAAYLVDREGQIVDTFLGPKPRRVLVKKIEALLEASPAT
jgi:thiol-disulfide isomerase/thioredoxin